MSCRAGGGSPFDDAHLDELGANAAGKWGIFHTQTLTAVGALATPGKASLECQPVGAKASVRASQVVLDAMPVSTLYDQP